MNCITSIGGLKDKSEEERERERRESRLISCIEMKKRCMMITTTKDGIFRGQAEWEMKVRESARRVYRGRGQTNKAAHRKKKS